MVHTYVVDRLTPEQISQLEAIGAAIVSGLAAAPCPSSPDSSDGCE
jgi:hypothetical protein